MTQHSIDAIDRLILGELQRDGSLSIAELADRIGMTAPPCWRRVRRLRETGILKRQLWELDPTKLGLGLTLYATVKLATHDAEATKAFREHVRDIPDIVECYILLGAIDVMIKIVVPDIHYYENFFYDRLSQIPGVREVNSSVVMSEVKRSTSLPLS